jgi:hypothetical protein
MYTPSKFKLHLVVVRFGRATPQRNLSRNLSRARVFKTGWWSAATSLRKGDIEGRMGKEISFKAEKKGREKSDLFSKHLTWSNAMERKVNIKYFIYETMGAQSL